MESSKSYKSILKNTFWCLKVIAKLNPLLIAETGAFQLLASTTPFFRNLLLAKLIDSLVYNSGQDWIFYFIIFVILLFATSAFLFLQSQFSSILDTKLQMQLRVLFIGKVSNLDYQQFENSETGNLISKVDEEFSWRMRQNITNLSIKQTN